MSKKIIIPIIILAVVLIIIFIFKKEESKSNGAYLLLHGNVEVTEINPGFKIPGRITALFVDEGDAVKAGQKIATIDDAELKDFVAQAEQQLKVIVANLKDLQSGLRHQEIQQAQANLNAAQADFVNAEKNYKRYKELYENGAVAAQQLDESTRMYSTAKAKRKAAEEALSLAKAGFRSEQIIAAEHRVKQAEAALAQAQEQLKNTVIYSPVGTVILKKNVEIGDIVAAGTPVFVMGDMSDPWVRVYVNEQDLGLVKLNQKALVNVDSYPGKDFDGYVSFISGRAEFTPKNIQTEEERVKLVFRVKVKVKDENGDLKPGMPADVKILLK
ncbi:MAG: efflux RND transporter periplasmic adaptor subunit [Armatimonadota bacterium]